MMHLNFYICSNSGLSIIHVHTLTNNPSRKHRSIRLNLTFEISHKESSKDKKNEIMLRLTFEGLADQIRIQHWQGRNFICRSGWILLNTPNKNDLDFLMLWCKGRELGYFRLLCKENLCVNVERALKSAELSKRMLYPHHKQYSSGQINQGKNYLTTKRLCDIGRKLIFWPKINLRMILFFPSLCNTRFGLSLTAHRETEAKLHVFNTTHPVYLPPKANEAQTGISRGDSHRMNP